MLFFIFTLIFFPITTRLELESGCSLQECWNQGGPCGITPFFCVCLGIFLASAADLLFFPGIFVWDTGPCREHMELSSFPTNIPSFPGIEGSPRGGTGG